VAIRVVSLSEKSYQFSWWERFYLVEIVRGLATTGKHLLKNLLGIGAIQTYEYPEQIKAIPDEYKAEHRLMQRLDGKIRCTACMLCSTACPADCIEIEAAESDDPTIEKYPLVYTINQLRCVYCGLCVEACPCDAIRMDTKKVDKSGYTREDFIVNIDYLKNNHPNGLSPYSIAIY
jgi:NADH-quinone oxidoreductase subunit I